MNNLIQLKHKEFQKRYGENNSNYLMMCRIINKYLQQDDSPETICHKTLQRYASGKYLPKKPDVIKAIAKLCDVSPSCLMSDLERYKKYLEEYKKC